MKLARIIFIAMLAAAASPAMATLSAAQPASTQPALIHRTTASEAQTTSAADSGPNAMRIVLSLAVVLALILILRWAGKRLWGGAFGGRSSRAIQVIARSPISSKHQLLIVQVGGRLLVLGEGGSQLTTLSEITDPDEAAALIGQIRGNESPEGEGAFAATLRRATLQLRKSQSARPTDEIDAPEFSSARQELIGLAERVRQVSRHLKRA